MDKEKILDGIKTLQHMKSVWAGGRVITWGGRTEDGVNDLLPFLESLLEVKYCKCKKGCKCE